MQPPSSAQCRIGLLWDSLSHNIGDQMVGVTLQRLLRDLGITDAQPMDIGKSITDEFDVIVVGGGELLQNERHGYYDFFKIPGRHILNTVGTTGPVDGSYLRDYRLVSVRSEADRRNIRGEVDVVVSPCLTVLFDDVYVEQDAQVPAGSLGVHLQPASFGLREVPEVISTLHGLGERVTLFPFTHYNQDFQLQTVLSEHLGISPPTPFATVDEAFALIRQFDAVIVTSLHATMMAYVSGVPFLSIGYSDKVRNFLEERGLGHRLIETFTDVPAHEDLLEGGCFDWDRQLAADRSRARALIERIVATLREVEATPAGTAGVAPESERATHPRSSHRSMMNVHEQYGQRFTDNVRMALVEMRHQETRSGLERRLAEVTQELESSGQYARHLEDELARVTKETLELGRYVRHVERELARVVEEASGTDRPTEDVDPDS